MKYAPSHMEYPHEKRMRILKEVCEIVGAVALMAAVAAMCFIGCIAF